MRKRNGSLQSRIRNRREIRSCLNNFQNSCQFATGPIGVWEVRLHMSLSFRNSMITIIRGTRSECDFGMFDSIVISPYLRRHVEYCSLQAKFQSSWRELFSCARPRSTGFEANRIESNQLKLTSASGTAFVWFPTPQGGERSGKDEIREDLE